jgi:hypothetical protein
VISPRSVPSSPSRTGAALATQLQVQYIGFADTVSRREYMLLARLGEETREYTVWIELAAFTTRKALRQDGPDICYQKLKRELASTPPLAASRIGVTEGDLASYRDAHTPKARL